MQRTSVKRGRLQDSSDDDSDGDSENGEEDVSWEPEEGAVFNVPMTEFYDDVSEIPGDILVPGNWRNQKRRGVFKEKIKNSGRGGNWKYGIIFEGDTQPPFYDNIYEWEECCSGVDLMESDDSDDAADPNAEVHTARRTAPQPNDGWLGMWLNYCRGKIGFGKYMSEVRFEQILRAFALPNDLDQKLSGFGNHLNHHPSKLQVSLSGVECTPRRLCSSWRARTACVASCEWGGTCR
jgi:hypothetical protein